MPLPVQRNVAIRIAVIVEPINRSSCLYKLAFEVPVNVNVSCYRTEFVIVQHLTEVKSCRFHVPCKVVSMFPYAQMSIACL